MGEVRVCVCVCLRRCSRSACQTRWPLISHPNNVIGPEATHSVSPADQPAVFHKDILTRTSYYYNNSHHACVATPNRLSHGGGFDLDIPERKMLHKSDSAPDYCKLHVHSAGLLQQISARTSNERRATHKVTQSYLRHAPWCVATGQAKNVVSPKHRQTSDRPAQSNGAASSRSTKRWAGKCAATTSYASTHKNSADITRETHHDTQHS